MIDYHRKNKLEDGAYVYGPEIRGIYYVRPFSVLEKGSHHGAR